jgi:hypothetical protein
MQQQGWILINNAERKKDTKENLQNDFIHVKFKAGQSIF